MVTGHVQTCPCLKLGGHIGGRHEVQSSATSRGKNFRKRRGDTFAANGTASEKPKQITAQALEQHHAAAAQQLQGGERFYQQLRSIFSECHKQARVASAEPVA